MSGLFGSSQGQPIATQANRANGMQVQSSNYGKALPVVYGRSRIAAELMWYGDFQAVEHQQQVGKGGGGNVSTSYTYSSSFALALCEGPIQKLGNIWNGAGTVALSDINGTLMTGAAGQAPWSHWTGSDALNYPHVAYVGCLNLLLGSTPSAPNLNFEIYGLLPFDSGTGIYDAEPSAIVTDILTNPQHGADFSAVGDLTQFRDYCTAVGIFISPVIDTETTLSDLLHTLLQITNSTVLWSDGALSFIPYGDQAITGNGVTYTPAITVQAVLTSDDFVKGVQIERKPLTDLNNVVRVEFLDSTNNYVTSVCQVQDQADIDQRGVRSEQTIQAHCITNGPLAMQVAQQILQRNLYIRNTYHFSVPLTFIALEPGDIVSLTDPLLGLDQEPVRITDVKEGANLELDITAEEFPAGVAAGAQYPTEVNAGFVPNIHGAPDATQTPVFFRGPQFLAPRPEVWIGVAGAGPNWGGAYVWASWDGAHYTRIGMVYPGCRYGELSSALAIGADPDTVNSFGVELYGPGQMNGGTQQDADELVTLMLVDQELISYETTVLNGNGTYTLGNGYLRRGAYATAIAAHAVNAPWLRIDDHIFRWACDPGDAGKTIYIKIQAFNLYGAGTQDLSTVVAYPYVLGAAEEVPDVPPVPLNFTAAPVADGVKLTWSNPNPAAVAMSSVERSIDDATWTVLGQVQGEFYTDHFQDGSSYYYRVRVRSKHFIWSAYAATQNAAGKIVPASSTLPNVIGTTADFTTAAAGWTVVAKSDNSVYADYRCAFDVTVTSIAVGAMGEPGTSRYKVSCGAAAADTTLSVIDGAPLTPVTLAQVIGYNNELYLAVYLPSGVTVHVACAPISGSWNGASAQAGAAAPAGIVVATLNLDPNNTGVSHTHIGMVGPGGKWHLFLDSGEVYHGGTQVLDATQTFLPGATKVKYTTGVTVDSLQPAEANADVTGTHTAADTTHVNGVVSASISPIAGLMPAEAGATNRQDHNLVANGYGENLNNTNFSTFTSSEAATNSDASPGAWRFITPLQATEFDGLCDQFFPIDPNRAYYEECWAEWWNNPDGAPSGPTTYLGFACYDATQRLIDYSNVTMVAGTGTTLAAQAAVGATSVTLTSGTGWSAGAGANYLVMDADNTHYTDMPNYDVYRITNVVGTAITLATALRQTYASGTSVRESQSGGTYNYALFSGGGISASSFNKYSAVITGSEAKPSPAHASQFRPGTAFVKFVAIVIPYGAGSYRQTLAVKGIAFAPMTEIDFSATTHLNKNQDYVPPGATYSNIAIGDVDATSRKHKLTLTGNNGSQLPDQFKNIALNGGGFATARWNGLTLTSTYNATAAKSNAGMSAATLTIGSNTISYNSQSTGYIFTPGATEYLGLDDPTYAGGSPSIVSSTLQSDLATNDGYVYMGADVMATASGGGGGTGNICVAADMFLHPNLQAKYARTGYWLDCAEHLQPIGRRKVLANGFGEAPCVELRSENGCELVVTEDTSFEVDASDASVLARDMLGHTVLTDLGISKIVGVTPLRDWQLVCRINAGNVSYAAGRDPHRRIFSHNSICP